MALLRPIIECNRVQIENGRVYLREMVFGDPADANHAEALRIVGGTEDAVAAINNSPVNEKSFRGYDPGEVRFAGMQSQLSTQNPDFVTASYDFEQTDNRNKANGNAIKIDNIQNIEKDGWDYLDVHYEHVVDTTSNSMVPKALYVLVHRVYDRSDFAPLNIGTDENLPMWQG